MSTYVMVKKSIESKKARGALTEAFVDATKTKLDVFLMAERITIEEYNELMAMLVI